MKNPKLLKKFSNFSNTIQYISKGLIPRYIRVVVWILRIDDPSPYFVLGDRIISLMENSGKTYSAIYLKEAFRITIKFISGTKEVKTLDELRMGIALGLPKILPSILRDHVRSRNRAETRAILTILSLYRVIKASPKLKIGTITAPYTGVAKPFTDWEVYNFSRDCLSRMKLFDSRFIVSMSAGPNSSPTTLGLYKDAIALYANPVLLRAYNVLAKRFNCQNLLANLLCEADIMVRSGVSKSTPSILSKLAFKEEPAGKVRVFAILDGWTQSVLSGLHDSIASILKNIEQDGTFDQDKPLKVLMATDPKSFFSFDLSAATDRLPSFIQVQLLSYIFNQEVAEA
jgi:hypothetical protein